MKKIIAEYDKISFKDSIIKYKIPTKIKIKKRDYKEKGLYPIIDQSTKFIAGYTDDSSKLFPYDKPLILFGDHTKIVKYVDFRFCLGADGVKVIIPKGELFSPKFFYYQLKNMKVESAGYSRHYKFLTNKKIIKPSREIQLEVVKIFEKFDKIKKLHLSFNTKTEELIKSIYLEIFGDPILNEKGFTVRKLGDNDVAELNMGGTPSTKIKEYYQDGTINWMKSGDIKGDFISSIPQKITSKGLEESNAKLYKKGDVVIALAGQGKTRGTNAILLTETSSNQSVVSISPKTLLKSEYLHYNLKYRYFQIRNLTGDKERSGLNLEILRNFEIPLPDTTLQSKFSSIVNKVKDLRDRQFGLKFDVFNLERSFIEENF